MGDIWPSAAGKITIGRLGENERMRVHLPIANLLEEIGEASFTLLNRRPDETTAYPIPTAERDDKYIIWTVTSRDTQIEGTGECQINATVDGVIAKTIIWTTEITRSLDGSGEVPDVWESWQEVFAGLKTDAEVAAEAAGASSDAAASSAERSSGSAANASSYASQARDSATSASQSAQSATGYASRAKDYMQQSLENLETATQCAEWAAEDADRAEAAAASIHDMTATAETLPEGSTASASYDSTSGTLTLGIPAGATGEQGPKGDPGLQGPQGEPGETGQAGYSPRASVTQTPDGAMITITDATGTTSAILTDGKIWDNLDAETDSYTPQVVIPCDDSGTAQGGVIAKRGRVLYINGTIQSNTRVCIFGHLDATRDSPSYANYPDWYGDPCDRFVVGHTYRYVPEILSGTIENASGNDLLVLRQKDDTYKSISAGSAAVCEVLPEAIFIMPRIGTYTNIKLYLHIVDVTASPVTDVQINGTSVVSSGIARINTPQWELIREETVINASEADIVINADSNGQAFELSDVRLVLVSPQQDTAFSKADYGRVRCYYQTGGYDIIFIGAYTQAANASAKVSYISFEQQDGMLTKVAMPNTSRGGMGPWQTYSTEDGEGCFVLPDTQRLYSRINITKVTGTLHYILYGRRK